MSLVDTVNGIMARRAWVWPRWICGAIDGELARVCGLPASWQQLPVAGAAAPWLYCDRHKPAGAERIPDDAPFSVTRLELKVALTGVPGDRHVAAEEAVRRLVYAIEAAGGLVTGLRVVGGKASAAPADGSPLRLTLAGRGEPAWQTSSRALEAPIASEWPRRRRRRTG